MRPAPYGADPIGPPKVAKLSAPAFFRVPLLKPQLHIKLMLNLKKKPKKQQW